MKNQKGFTQILLISVLPVIVGGFIIFHSAMGLIQLNTIVNSECRRQQISAQTEIRNLMLKLFSKNPRAMSLRTQLFQTRIQLAAAIASYNVPLAQALQLRIRYLIFQRQILDVYQKELIAQANLLSIKSTFQIYSQNIKNMNEAQSLSPLLQISTRSLPPIPPKLPVVPDIADVAPVYRTASDFSNRQAFVQKWQYKIRVNKLLQNFVKADASFEKLCSTTIEGAKDQWIITTKEDKS